MRPYSPGGGVSAFATTLRGLPSQRLVLFVYGMEYQGIYSCLLPTLSRLSVSIGPESRLRPWCSSRYLRISPLHREIPSPLPYSSRVVSNALLLLSRRLSHLTYPTTYTRFTPNNSEQRSHPPYYRGCWHGVSRCFLRWYRQLRMVLTFTGILPTDRELRPEGLHHPRGVAASRFPPLRKIPHICLP